MYGEPESFADAKARNCCIIEVKCQITQEKDGKTYYLWGYESGDKEYESIFYPYQQWNCTAEWMMTLNGYYYLFMDNNGCDENGVSPIVPHPESGGDTSFKISSQIEFRTKVDELTGGTADAWSNDADNNSATVKM